MHPPDFGRLGRYLETIVQEALIKAVARPEHQLMPSGPHRLPVPVGRGVVNAEDRHTQAQFAATSLIAKGMTCEPDSIRSHRDRDGPPDAGFECKAALVHRFFLPRG